MKIVTECDTKGDFDVLLGQKVLVFCANYIYHGCLKGVGESALLLENASIVYETGPLDAATLKDAQRLPSDKWYVNRNLVESIGVAKC